MATGKPGPFVETEAGFENEQPVVENFDCNMHFY